MAISLARPCSRRARSPRARSSIASRLDFRSGAKPPSSPTAVERPFFVQHAAERVEDLGAPAQRLGEGRRAEREEHELLEVDVVVGVRAAVQHVHHRARAGARACVAAEEAVERLAGDGRAGVGRGERDAEHRVRAEARLGLGPVEGDQRLDRGFLDPPALPSGRLCDRVRNLAVDVRRRPSARPSRRSGPGRRRAARAPRASRSRRRTARPRGRAPARGAHLDLDGRVPARVQDLAAVHARDRIGRHGFPPSKDREE